MEKHPIASQSFLPIQDYDWLIIVSEEKNELPDLNILRCFHVNGDTVLHIIKIFASTLFS